LDVGYAEAWVDEFGEAHGDCSVDYLYAVEGVVLVVGGLDKGYEWGADGVALMDPAAVDAVGEIVVDVGE